MRRRPVTHSTPENVFGSAYNVLFRRQTGPGIADTKTLTRSQPQSSVISIGQNESLTALKRIGKIISVSWNSLVTLTRASRFAKLITIGGTGAPALVQGNSHQNGGATSTTVAVTLAAPVGVGNLVCVSVGFAGASGHTATVADDQGNTYTPVNSVFDSGQSYKWLTFYKQNISNAPQTITATISNANAFESIVVDEFSGVVASSALDGHTINDQPTIASGTGVTSGNCTTTVNGNLVYGTSVNVSGVGTFTKGASFTQGASANNVAGLFNTEYLVQAAASASTSATYTHSATDTFITAVMCFKAAAQASQAITLTRLRAGLKAITLSSAELVTLTRREVRAHDHNCNGGR